MVSVHTYACTCVPVLTNRWMLDRRSAQPHGRRHAIKWPLHERACSQKVPRIGSSCLMSCTESRVTMDSENVVSSPDARAAPVATADLEPTTGPAFGTATAAKQPPVRMKVTIDAFVCNFCDSCLGEQFECNCGIFFKQHGASMVSLWVRTADGPLRIPDSHVRDRRVYSNMKAGRLYSYFRVGCPTCAKEIPLWVRTGKTLNPPVYHYTCDLKCCTVQVIVTRAAHTS